MYTYIKLFNANVMQSILEQDVNKWLDNNKYNIEIVDIRTNDNILIIIYKARKAY
jgi:hypothetical protein